MTAFYVPPLECDLTEAALRNMKADPSDTADPGIRPLVAGNTWKPRFQVRDGADAAVSLAGASVLMTIKKQETDSDAQALLTRTSSGLSPTVFIDADQTAETGETGKGWFEVRFLPADKTVLLTMTGTFVYDIQVTFADSSVLTAARGAIEILRPRTGT